SAVGRGGNSYLLAERAHRDALADHYVIVVEPLSKQPVIGFELALAERVANSQDCALDLERFFNKVERAQPRGAHGRFDVRVAADHNHSGLRVSCFQMLKSFDAVHARQPYVQKDTAENPALECFEALFTRRGSLYRHAFVFEDARKRLPYSFFIVYNKN